jgi:putative DNA primase/helicase
MDTARNENGFQLAIQLRDSGLSIEEATEAMRRHVAAAPAGDHPYTEQEALASLDQAYSRPPRAPSFDLDTLALPGPEAEPLILKAPADHGGHTTVFKALYGSQFCFVEELGWLVYENGYWSRTLATQRLNTSIQQCLRARAKAAKEAENTPLKRKCEVSRSNVDAIRTFAQMELLRSVTDFNEAPHLINCANGVLDLKTLELKGHSPSLMFTHRLDAAWTPTVDMTEWENFVLECVGGDLEAAKLLQLCAGYSITGDTSGEVMFYLYGPPRSGKGTFMTAIQNLLAPLAGTINIGTLCAANKSDTQNFELAGLQHSRYVTAAETGRSTYLDAPRVKIATGNDPISCAHKFKAHFSYTPKFKIWVSSNHEINMDGADDAVWDRMRIFQFPTSHKDKPDTSLKQRLTTNLEPVLRWCAEGAQMALGLLAKGEPIPRTDAMRQYVAERQVESDYVKQFLEQHGIVPGHDDRQYKLKIDLYTQFRGFCTANHVDFPMSPNNFVSELKRRGFIYKQKKHQGVNTRVFVVAVKAPDASNQV